MGSTPDYIVLVCEDVDICFRHAIQAANVGKEVEIVITEDYFRWRVCERCVDERANGVPWNPLEH